ncbi:glycerophosphoryl diester phosphodiesterase [Jiangella asiatica]|uniref:Glycerophosphoryl diester phosphodiesterase n=1 Tax=Jiangella asiatica TaxID=2530372 RepID=A0A4V2Z095_9ACTN|nr:glycerophosphoryl diester phosphodiesterase [Jiangella asiatica]TDE00158.1 glycerophosphoryl diester phosphodiesterase [Jiangella asiatica]
MNQPSGNMPRRTLLKYAAVGGAGIVVPIVVASGSAVAGEVDDDSTLLLNRATMVKWKRTAGGWGLDSLRIRSHRAWRRVLNPSGRYGIWSASSAPSAETVQRATAGTVATFLPQQARRDRQGVTFTATQPTGTMVAVWRFDPDHPTDLLVTLTWTPNAAGWYSVPSPTLATVDDDDLGWGVVPGYWSSATLAADDDLTYLYQIGVPKAPMVTTEASTTSLTAIVSSRARGTTLAVVADPSLARDPWADDTSTQNTWKVGTSLRALTGELSPTSFYPVLGQAGSQLAAGEPVTATFRYVLSDAGWYEVSKHVTRDVYGLGDYLALAAASESLSHRINRMHDHLVTPQSRWHTWEYEGLTLGAEGSKISDVGAMWMMDAITGDPIIHHDRLPYARNFKLAQQQTAEGPFRGAALGEYFRNGQFVSAIVGAATGIDEPDYVTPSFTTYYTLADMANIVLFDPSDTELRDRIRLGADKLLSWQHDDGSFDIGYQRENPDALQYPELTDLRATWYGFLAAYRILGDRKYLDAAQQGADWFVEHAVKTGDFLGLCDDFRIIRDFQVIFAAQALLELHELTGTQAYLDAAISCARFYTLHIHNHPTPTAATKTFHGVEMEDWRASQVGMCFEHSGFTGSANKEGPMLLSCHAGAFVRFHELTGDEHFLDLARAAARGRDAFVGPETGTPSYYWRDGNGASTQFPWHAWWHIGWIVDYLLAEAHLRTEGKISFPPGLCTAKVGAHRPFGFAPGTVYGKDANLWMPRTLLVVDKSDVDVVTARSIDGSRLYVVALNQLGAATSATITLNPRAVEQGRLATWTGWDVITGEGTKTAADEWSVRLAPNGVAVLEIELRLADDPQGPELRTFRVEGAYRAPVVSWSYFTTVEAWVQWREADGETWTDTNRSTGYDFNQTLDLSDVTAPAVVEVRIATLLPSGDIGCSEVTRWNVPRQYLPDGPNIALNRPVEVSSIYQPQYTGDKAVDGNTADNASRWLSAVGDLEPSITVHLATVTTPKLVRIYSGGAIARGRLVSAMVQTRSADGSWTQVGAVSGNTEPRLDIPLDSGPTDQVRLVATDPSRDEIDVVRMYELEIYDQVR